MSHTHQEVQQSSAHSLSVKSDMAATPQLRKAWLEGWNAGDIDSLFQCLKKASRRLDSGWYESLLEQLCLGEKPGKITRMKFGLRRKFEEEIPLYLVVPGASAWLGGGAGLVLGLMFLGGPVGIALGVAGVGAGLALSGITLASVSSVEGLLGYEDKLRRSWLVACSALRNSLRYDMELRSALKCPAWLSKKEQALIKRFLSEIRGSDLLEMLERYQQYLAEKSAEKKDGQVLKAGQGKSNPDQLRDRVPLAWRMPPGSVKSAMEAKQLREKVNQLEEKLQATELCKQAVQIEKKENEEKSQRHIQTIEQEAAEEKRRLAEQLEQAKQEVKIVKQASADQEKKAQQDVSEARNRAKAFEAEAKEASEREKLAEERARASEGVSRKRKEKGKKLKDRIEALIEKFEREGAEKAQQEKARFEASLERFTREAGERERLASERRAEEAQQEKAKFEASLERFTREAGERERLASERRAEEAQQEKAKFEASLERFTREAGERERLASERRAEEAQQEKARFEASLERFTREAAERERQAEEEKQASEARWERRVRVAEARIEEEEKASEARWAERARGLEALAQQQLEEIKQVFAKQHEQLLLSFDTERSKQSALINQQAQRIDVLTERLAAADRIFSALDEKLSDEPVSERLEEKSGVQAEARVEGSDEGLGGESIYDPRFFGSTGKNAAKDCVRVVVKEPEGEEKETVVEGVVARGENSARTLESELGVMGEAGSGPEAIELVTVREGCSRF